MGLPAARADRRGLIARGNCVYVAAASQTGKTLLGVYLARKLVTGGKLFDRYAITPVEHLL
jgi:RecA-family ATPase